jgi:hypothetical protein
LTIYDGTAGAELVSDLLLRDLSLSLLGKKSALNFIANRTWVDWITNMLGR